MKYLARLVTNWAFWLYQKKLDLIDPEKAYLRRVLLYGYDEKYRKHDEELRKFVEGKVEKLIRGWLASHFYFVLPWIPGNLKYPYPLMVLGLSATITMFCALVTITEK